MKKKLLLTALMVAIFCVAFAISASCATYYVDKDGKIASSTSDNLAYEFDTSGSNGSYTVSALYLYDTTITTIVMPDFEEITKLNISSWASALKVYDVKNKGKELTSEMELQTQIKEFDTYEHIALDGANGQMGCFMNWNGLERFIFRANFSYGKKSGMFYGCSNLREMHFYGQDIKVPYFFTNVLKYNLEGKGMIVFHESATGTLSTSYDTLPAAFNLEDNFVIIINENIKPSNPDDTRLGALYGQVSYTNGWELIVAVTDKNNYTNEQLEALKTAHGFASRAKTVDEATIKEASVATYCELGLMDHVGDNSYVYPNGYTQAGSKLLTCTKGCGYSDEIEQLSPLFSLNGYSYANSAIMQSFQIDMDAIENYQNLSGKEIKYGILAASGSLTTLNSGTTFVDNVVSVDFTNRSYDIMEMKIYGITTATKDTALYCCGYIEVDGDIIYMDKNMAESAELPATVTYAGLGGTFVAEASLDAVVPTKENEVVA